MRRRGSANKRDASVEAPGQASEARTICVHRDRARVRMEGATVRWLGVEDVVRPSCNLPLL